RIVAQGTKEELLHSAGTLVKAEDETAMATALSAAGVTTSSASGGGLRADAIPEQVGKVAADAGIALSELRPAETAGLEEMFLQLTEDSQREAGPANTVGAH